jgi:hypothetical protein
MKIRDSGKMKQTKAMKKAGEIDRRNAMRRGQRRRELESMVQARVKAGGARRKRKTRIVEFYANISLALSWPKALVSSSVRLWEAHIAYESVA